MSVIDVIVLDHVSSCSFVRIFFIRNANQPEDTSLGLPEGVDSRLNVSHAIGLTNGVIKLVGFQLPLGVIPEVMCLQEELFVVSGFEPAHHGVGIDLPDQVLISPLVILGAEVNERLPVLLFVNGVVVISQPQHMLVVAASLLHHEGVGLRELVEESLIDLFSLENMLDFVHMVVLQVND